MAAFKHPCAALLTSDKRKSASLGLKETGPFPLAPHLYITLSSTVPPAAFLCTTLCIAFVCYLKGYPKWMIPSGALQSALASTKPNLSQRGRPDSIGAHARLQRESLNQGEAEVLWEELQIVLAQTLRSLVLLIQPLLQVWKTTSPAWRKANSWQLRRPPKLMPKSKQRRVSSMSTSPRSYHLLLRPRSRLLPELPLGATAQVQSMVRCTLQMATTFAILKSTTCEIATH